MICVINVVASAFAVAWVTRPYWRSAPAPTLGAMGTAPREVPSKGTPELWAEFERAGTQDAALLALRGIEPAGERERLLAEYLSAARLATVANASLPESCRHAAAIASWGETAEVGGEAFERLQALALDRGRTPLERDAALRAVMLAAQRRHKAAAEAGGEGWREALAVFLADNEFGRGTSTEALALHAMGFALAEDIAPVRRETLVARLGRHLTARNGASEAVQIAALEVAQQIAAVELLNTVRALATQPVSDACQMAILNFLGTQGGPAEAEWLNGYIPATAALQTAGANARAFLLRKLEAATVTTAPGK